MNNIELREIRKDTIKFFGEGRANKIDGMNSNQLDKLKSEIHRIKNSTMPSHIELRNRKKNMVILDVDEAMSCPSHIELRKKKIEARKNPTFGPEISVIIPYMHTTERFPLLMSCISSLRSDIEICVVEIGKKRKVFLPPEEFEYMFVQYSNVMHRGWALNLGARHLSTGKKLVLLDADVIIPNNFFKMVKWCDYPAVAWNKMYYLNQENSKDYMIRLLQKGERGIFDEYALGEKCETVKEPRFDGAAGGITVVPRDIFFQLKGVPENFEGTWGGPDNAFAAKLRAFGYAFKTLNLNSIHLYHSKNTPRNNNIALKAREMMRWTKNQWSNEINAIGNDWGNKQKSTLGSTKQTSFVLPDYMTIENLRNIVVHNEEPEIFTKQQIINDLTEMWTGFNRGTLERVFNTEETILSVAMLSLLRTSTMLNMLDHWNKNRFIKSSIAFNIQGSEWLSKTNKDRIEKKVENYFDKSFLSFTNSNRGTGVPRHNMVHKALEFNTPYIMTTDDDMFFPPGSIEALISILEDNPEYGAVDLWVHPNLNAWFAGQDKMIFKQPKSPFGLVDGMGSASMIVRREVFQTCDYDHLYYVGWADIDFCMQMRKNKWKIGILAIPDYKALNFKARGTDEYRKYAQYRHDVQHASNSSVRFQQKWGRQI